MKNEDIEKFMANKNITIVEAMEKIDINGRGILFVTDEKQKLIGTVTDGDIRRWLIKTGKMDVIIERIMNKSPKVIYRKEIKIAQEFMKKYLINAVAVVTTKNCITDIIFKEDVFAAKQKENTGLKDVPVVIMAGGKGTRLYPYTKVLPKPLIPIGDIPIMERIINSFRESGVEKFYATVNYKKNMIRSYFDGIDDYKVIYVEEDMPLGTGGSLRLLENEFERPFIVTNCDILVNTDYTNIYKNHMENNNEMTIVSAVKNIVVPYGVLHSGANGVITDMEEKPKFSYFVNTGMYIINPELIKEIPKNTFYHMTELADKLIKEGRKVGMYPVSEEVFLDMGEMEEMRRMEQKLSMHT